MMHPSSPLDSLAKSVQALSTKKNAIHIKSLRFPNYRGLEPNVVLPFEFPITALLGRNGTNKSSILHALYGSTRGNTIADFWFETKLDAIPATKNGLKQSVVHTYQNKHGQQVECIKARAPRQDDPDYWEAVKPTGPYGFATGLARVSPIALTVTHLDFRGELPAFDKYFYFPDQTHLERRDKYAKIKKTFARRTYRKQDYLRRRSQRLKSELSKSGQDLTDRELDILRYILERTYESGRLLRHNLFHGHEGYTIVFRTPALRGYSDAFAGSGESAATLLVHKVLSAPKGSLILLDEPETSLHPRAQQRMLEFLAHEAVRNDLQIVMATHSVFLAGGLPSSAIRVLETTASGEIHISTSCSASEAFHEIGDAPSGKTIIVEDERAKHMVVSALGAASAQAQHAIRVVVRDGGTSRIFRDLQAHANAGRTDVFIALDGDHRPSADLPPKGSLPQGERELRKLVRDYTKGPNSSGPELDFVDGSEINRYLEFLRTQLYFLPGQTPESVVWNDAVVAQLLGMASLPAAIRDEPDRKHALMLASHQALGLDPDTIFKVLVSKFLIRPSQDRTDLEALISTIRQAS